MNTRITIIGDGGWGTALALVCHANGHDVTVWSAFAQNAAEINRHHENRSFLPGIKLPQEIVFTADRQQAVAQADLVIIAVPTRYYTDVLKSFKDSIPAKALLLSVTKGIEQESGRCMSTVAEELLNRQGIAALSGPSHAEETARNIPTAVTVAAASGNDAATIQQLLTGGNFRVYTSDDVKGVQLGGALKNIIAIAVGMSDGIGFGDNTRAALITRGLVEITRLGCALGAQAETFAGLSGMGDLIVTCTSRHSRNRGLGEKIGKGGDAHKILAGMQQVAEGAWNCAAAYHLAQKLKVTMPVTSEVYAILHENKPPAEAVAALLSREPKQE